MPQQPVGGPLLEPDLGHQLRPGPVHLVPRDVGPGLERRALPFQPGQRRVQAGQHRGREPGPDLARVDQPPVRVVVPGQQRTEVRPGALGVGESPDDELLRRLALELQPVPAAAAPVRPGGPLGDQPFPAVRAGLPVVRQPVAVPVPGLAQRAAERDQLVQQALPVAQRQPAQVPPVQEHQVEQVVEDLHLADELGLGHRDLHALLHPGEAGLLAVERDDLAVGHEVQLGCWLSASVSSG